MDYDHRPLEDDLRRLTLATCRARRQRALARFIALTPGERRSERAILRELRAWLHSLTHRRPPRAS